MLVINFVFLQYVWLLSIDSLFKYTYMFTRDSPLSTTQFFAHNINADVFDPTRRKGVLRGFRGDSKKSKTTASFQFSSAFETSTKYFERMSKRNPAEQLSVPKYGRKKVPPL